MAGASIVERQLVVIRHRQRGVGGAAERHGILDLVRARRLRIEGRGGVGTLRGASLVAAGSDDAGKEETVAKAHAYRATTASIRSRVRGELSPQMDGPISDGQADRGLEDRIPEDRGRNVERRLPRPVSPREFAR